MKNLLIFSCLILAVSCCSFQPGCIIQDKAVDFSTNVIVDKLQCKNKAAVKSSMQSVMGAVGLCDQNQTGPIADYLCPVAVDAVVKYVSSSVIPSNWQCSAANVKDQLGGFLTAACRMVPVEK